MVSTWKRFLTSAALAASLQGAISTPALAEQPPFSPAETERVKTDDPLTEKVEDQKAFFERIALHFNWNWFSLYPTATSAPERSLLAIIDSEEIPVHTFGLSLDCFVGKTSSYHNWHGALPVGIFFDISSSHFLGTLEDRGIVSYQGIRAGYRIKSKMDYLAIGFTVSPAVIYQNGPVEIGLGIDLKGGLSSLTSKSTFTVGISDKAIREVIRGLGADPDAEGTLFVRGVGGFLQALAGPVVNVSGVVCSGGAGIRYDWLTLHAREEIDNPSLRKEMVGQYTATYGEPALVVGARCGYRF